MLSCLLGYITLLSLSGFLFGWEVSAALLLQAIFANLLLIDLSRHSDHHFYASKPFNQLASYPESPVLPGGYASMLLPALIPPLWFSLVNKRIPADLSTRS